MLTREYQLPKLISSLKSFTGDITISLTDTVSMFQNCLVIYSVFHSNYLKSDHQQVQQHRTPRLNHLAADPNPALKQYKHPPYHKNNTQLTQENNKQPVHQNTTRHTKLYPNKQTDLERSSVKTLAGTKGVVKPVLRSSNLPTSCMRGHNIVQK